MITIVAPRSLSPLESTILRDSKRRSSASSMKIRFLPSLELGTGPGVNTPSAVIVLGNRLPDTKAPIVPTLSPEQLSTRADAVSVLTEAFCLAAQHENDTLPPSPDGSYILAERRWQVLDWLDEACSQEWADLYLDIETQGDITKLHHSERYLLSLALHSRLLGQTLVVPDELLTSEWPDLIRALGRMRLSAHNGKFDLATLCIRLGVPPGALKLSFDSMLAHYVLQPGGLEHGLEPLCVRYLGAEPWDVGGDKADMASLDRHTMYTYNALDAQWGDRLRHRLERQVDADADARRALYYVLMNASHMLQQIEPEGIGFDTAYTGGRLADELSARAERHKRELIRMAHTVLPRTRTVGKARSKTTKDPHTGKKVRQTWTEQVEVPYEFNPGSWQQVKALYKQVGTELPSTDKATLQPRADAGDSFARELLDWRHVTKQLSTYAVSLLKKEDRVHGGTRRYPSYKLHGTVTGRLSSENPNIQNIPRDKKLRRMFVPTAPDRLLCQVDFGQAELRVIAAESGDDWLLNLFHNPDVDVFTQMLPSVFPSVDFASIDDAQLKELRAKLKGVVYGLNFGRQAPAIAGAIGAPVGEAQRIIDTFFDSGPRIADFRREVIRSVHTGTPLVSRFGRHFQHEVLTSRNAKDVERSALSFKPQSNSSDVTLMSAVDMHRWTQDKRRDWRIVALVHDAVTIDVPEKEVEDASGVLSDIMLNRAKKHFPEVPFAVDAKWGTDWSQTS